MKADVTTINDLMKREDIPVVIANSQGFITFINDPFEDVFGWQKDEIIGDILTRIIPEELHDAHNMGFSRFLLTGNATILNQPLKLKAINKAGEVFEAEHFIIAEKQSDGNWLIGSSIDPCG